MSPTTFAVVTGGVPEIVVGACGAAPMYGVMRYDVMGDPPFAGALHETVADASPATAVAAVGGAGAVGGPEGVNETST